jgi:hypothetical protein
MQPENDTIFVGECRKEADSSYTITSFLFR